MAHSINLPSPRYRLLLQLLHTADSLWNTSHLFFARWNLSPSQFNVLNLLHGQLEGLSQIELSRELIMHRSNVTGLVDRLEKRGLLKRNSSATDRRAYRVVLTPNGQKLIMEILPLYHATAEQVLETFTITRAKHLISELSELEHKTEKMAATL